MWPRCATAAKASPCSVTATVSPVTGDMRAVTTHGGTFAAVVQRGHIGGVQFHPEKSGDVGLRILRNFVELAG